MRSIKNMLVDMYITDFKSVKDKDISSNVIICCFFVYSDFNLKSSKKIDSDSLVVTEIKSEKYVVIATIMR